MLHAGDKPYIVSPAGQTEILSRPSSARALDALLLELLPPGCRAVLNATGSVQWELPASPDLPDSRFVVAARVANDPWVEVRRYAPQTPHRRLQRKERSIDEGDLTLPSADELWPGGSEDCLDAAP